MEIRKTDEKNAEKILKWDRHITKEELTNLIGLGRVYVLETENQFAGWLRYNLFWDNTPFMNMLYILEEFRGRGFAAALAEFWEGEMRTRGYSVVMTSTVSREYAQHFYHRLGYRTVGGFLPHGEFYEVILEKVL